MHGKLWVSVLLASMTLPVTAIDLAQVPLYLAARAEPNIMFTLDDSGSMHFEIMPESLIENDARYVYPRANKIYGNADYDNYTITFDSNNDRNAYTRSNYNNKLYYNPLVTYRPWVKADGSLMPPAPITCAPHNPFHTSSNLDARCRNLTVDNKEYANADNASFYKEFSSESRNGKETFWPAVYFDYKGSGDVKNYKSYNQVEIRPGNTYPNRPARSDCASKPVCSYEEEIQNFANWYTYYRSRILAARAGVGRAFATQGDGIRVGFATINANPTIVKDVLAFKDAARTDFFTSLYERNIPKAGTPLRTALKDVGEHFKSKSNNGPWATTPGSALPHLTCRQSYNILMTDGYWNGDSPGVGDTDGDKYSNTLADVAYKYWKEDLRPDLANKVPTSSADNANWQHLVNFTVGFGVNGTKDPANGIPTSWPNPYDSDAKKIDDLWHAAVNSRGDFFSATDPDEFATALSSTLSQIAARNSSASSVTANATRLNDGSQIYQARFNSGDWSGQLLAIALAKDGSLGSTLWDAAQKIPQPAARKVFTWQAGAGVEFTWNALNDANKALLAINNDGLGQARLDYLRGERSQEQAQGGGMRNRSGILGDIVNSDPLFVGKKDYGYASASGLIDSERDAYRLFQNANLQTQRVPMIYVGANDGMLHGFRATDGVEQMAYLPADLLGHVSALTQPAYNHRYFVDGSPRVGDAYINNGWKTVLLGHTGAGGSAVFALDVTDPTNMAANKVLWEFSRASKDGGEMGVALATSTLVRVKADNKWVALVANGYNSISHTARLFVLDLATGAVLKELDTKMGNATAPNGLSSPLPVDADGDRVVDYVYAGDLQGNLWKFDLSGNIAQWDVAIKQGKPLFTACDGSCSATTRQPVTIRPVAIRHPQGGVMVLFGTGSYIANSDKVVPAQPRLDAVYGIWDKDNTEVGAGLLTTQSITHEFVADGINRMFDTRVVSNINVDYQTKRGWLLKLKSPGASTGVGERVVSEMIYRNNRLIFNTLIPSLDACDFGGRSWLMEIDPLSGARLNYSVFDVNGDGAINDKDYVTIDDGNGGQIRVPVSGKLFDELTTTPSVVEDGELERKYMSGSSGNVTVTLEQGAGEQGGRQSWLQLQ